jgi:hypothetical protein
VDNGTVQTLTAHLEATGGVQDDPAKQRWAEAVKNNDMVVQADLGNLTRGKHVVKLWRIDDNVVPQQLALTMA